MFRTLALSFLIRISSKNWRFCVEKFSPFQDQKFINLSSHIHPKHPFLSIFSVIFLAIIIGLFYLCWIPFFAGILLTIFKQEAVSYLYIAFVTCLAYSNSAINPLVYGWLNQEFKNTYKRLVKGLLRFTRPRCLSTKSNVTHVTRIKTSSVRNTVTATISATHSEIVSQNFRPASCFTGNL